MSGGSRSPIVLRRNSIQLIPDLVQKITKDMSIS
jgi:hypothetical protein